MPRPGPERKLDPITGRRLATVVAGAGFGKSTLLATWTAGRHAAWYSLDADDRTLSVLVQGLVAALKRRVPAAADELARLVAGGQGPDEQSDEARRGQAYAALVSDVLAERLDEDVVLVLDDVHEAYGSPGATRFIESLVRVAPPSLHLVLASRQPLPFPVERLRGQGQVIDLDATVLAFSLEEVGRLLDDLVGPGADDLAPRVHAATGGWPAAVMLVAESLRDDRPDQRTATLRRLQRPEGPLFEYIATEALGHESVETIAWLRLAAHFERFDQDLLEAVGWDARGGRLAVGGRPSVFLQPIPGEPGWYRLHGLIREYAIARLPIDDGELGEIQRRAAAWFEAHGLTDEALQAFAAAGDTGSVARLLGERGAAMLEAGSLDRILAAEALLPEDLRGVGSERLYGDALLARGDWRGALAAYTRAGGVDDEVEAGLAWRIGLIQYLRGELLEALETLERARLDGSAPVDEALVLAWTASVSWLFGEAARCRPPAERALELAERTGDDRALAAAHMATALVLILEGDMHGSEREHRLALTFAERCGDVLQIVRVRDNLGDHLLEDGRYAEALAELDGVVRLADAVGFASYHALALANRGQAHVGLGHFEEAMADFDAARAIYQRIGSNWVAYPIAKQADAFRLRGDRALARTAYEEAIRISERTGDRQILVPSLVGLAQTVVADEPGHARALTERAIELGREMTPVVALLGAARVALVLGETGSAIQQARKAAEVARRRGDQPGFASALEVEAEAEADVGADRPGALARLDEAAAIWRSCGSPVGEARNLLIRAGILGGGEGRGAALEAERRFAALGARGAATEARAVAELAEAADRRPVTIEALGGFRLLRDDLPVGSTEWQSKKARDLLKMLVARRGRPTAREALIEALWPDSDPEPLGNRFSVVLTTIRSILDPARRFPPDHFVVADKSSVALAFDNIACDVTSFFASVTEGRRFRREGRANDALASFATAERLYAGDFLEDDPYEEWAAQVREEAQAAYVSVTRALGEAAAASNDEDAASRFFLRILDRDGFDEAAHIALVRVMLAVGRHGEARRRYGLYAARMNEIGVEAAPFPVQPPRSVAVALEH
jgi:ATP/maltotriose-dependent transcriptional regulator MalT/DNA-binding SARP family transcriptional activator